MKLPRLAAVQQPKRLGFDLLVIEIDNPHQPQVLLDPRILDGFWIDPVEALGQVAEGAVRKFLHLENVLHLRFGQRTLFDQQLSNLNAWQRSLLLVHWLYRTDWRLA